MNKHKWTKKMWIVLAVAVIVVPLVLWSFPSNPPLGKTGAPGEGSCADCHGGGPGGGSIKVTSATGTTYHPGTKKAFVVTITDPTATEWGYEMTAVQATHPTVGEGVFTKGDNNSGVRSQNGKSYAAQVNDQSGKTKKVTFKVYWTPPKTNVGNVTLYFASNASESTYNGNLTLTPK